MREIAGAIIVLAGAVLAAAGIVAEAVRPSDNNVGYVLGVIVGCIGIGVLSSGTVRRAWDAIPTDPPRKAASKLETHT